MTYKKTAPFSLSKKTAHSDDLTSLAEENRRMLQTDSENPAFEKLTNNPMIVTTHADTALPDPMKNR